MSLFRGERRAAYGNPAWSAFENPAVPLSSVGLDSAFGLMQSTESGESVTIDRAVTLPVVYRCVALLSTVIAGCPLLVYTQDGRKPVRIAPLDPQNAQTTYTQFELWELVVSHLAFYGNAFVRKVRGVGPDGPGSGIVLDLRPINPSLVKVKLDADGNKIFEVKRVDPKTGQVKTGAEPVVYTDFEVMHIPGLGYDGLQGLSPIDLAKQAIGTGLAADKLAARFYGRGTQLTGVINVKAPLADQTQADKIRAKWISRNGGTANGAEVAVLDAETTFQPLTIPPDQLQFLESRRWQTTEIARLFGIPPHLVGDVEKSTSWGTGIEQQNVGFVSYTINGWTRRIEQRVTRELTPRGQYSEFDLNHLLRGDTSERFTAYGLAIQWGWLTRNEARLKENMEPIDGLDEPLTPLNMVAGSVKIDPTTGQPTPSPGADLNGPLMTTKKPGAGPSDENLGGS